MSTAVLLPEASPPVTAPPAKQHACFSSSAGEFKTFLHRLAKASDRSGMVDGLAGVLIMADKSGVEGFATDGINSAFAHLSATVKQEGELALPLHFLNKVVASIPNDAVLVVKATDKMTKIQHPTGELRIMSQDARSSRLRVAFDARPEQVSDQAVRTPAKNLKEAVKAISFAASGTVASMASAAQIVAKNGEVQLAATNITVAAQSIFKTELDTKIEACLMTEEGLALLGSVQSTDGLVSLDCLSNHLVVDCEDGLSRMDIGLKAGNFPNISSLWATRPEGSYQTAGSRLQGILTRFNSQGIDVIHMQIVGEELVLKGNGDFSSAEERVPVTSASSPGPLAINVNVGYMLGMVAGCSVDDGAINLTTDPKNSRIYVGARSEDHEHRFVIGCVKV